MGVAENLSCSVHAESTTNIDHASSGARSAQPASTAQIGSALRERLYKRRLQKRQSGHFLPDSGSPTGVFKKTGAPRVVGSSKPVTASEFSLSHRKAAQQSIQSKSLAATPTQDCPRLAKYPWQNRERSLDPLQIKPRHVEIKVPQEQVSTTSNYCGPSTPKESTTSLEDFPQPPEKSRSILKTAKRPVLPPFKFPNPSAKSLPPSPPWTEYDLVHGKPQLITRQGKQKRVRIVPDTPPSSASSTPSTPISRRRLVMATNGVTSPSSSANIASLAQQNNAPSNNLSSLVCNVNRTTGERPPPLVGASSVIVGDRMYVFGGRRLSRSKPNLTNTLFEIDLVSRHWRRVHTHGNRPIPRYFHSMNALGDTKLVCFGGMASGADVEDPSLARTDSGMVLLNDLHLYDIATRTWTFMRCPDPPRGRYAHCAVVLPSTLIMTANSSPNSATPGHSPSASQSGIQDGRGGAQLVVIGGQTPENKYVMEINVFNFRSRKWTRKDALDKEYGAYRSVAIPLTNISTSQIGSVTSDQPNASFQADDDDQEGHATLIYSNYNFLDVKLEFCLRHPDGQLTEHPMRGTHSPPGLRFPNGDVHNHHFILSGTFLTSTRKEYALWALDLRSLTWTRIDVGPGILTSGSWNRGLLWRKRNTYVVFGDRRRKLDADYNHRRLNFANMMTVELEAYGLYDNPVTHLPGANFASSSSPYPVRSLRNPSPLTDRPLHSEAAATLGRSLLEHRELADLDLLAIGGERIPCNSLVIAKRWGPYLLHLLEGTNTSNRNTVNGIHSHEPNTAPNGRPMTLSSQQSRNSSLTITPSSVTNSNTLTNTRSHTSGRLSPSPSNLTGTTNASNPETVVDPNFGLSTILPATTRPRVLYLPHTAPTVRCLLHYLYTWSLPPPNHPLCSAQILCSLLQIARPYRIDGLLEATVERLHQVLDARNTAAVFNAAAMAAGGGDAVAFAGSARLGRQRHQVDEGDAVSEDEDRPGSVSSASESGASESSRGGSEKEEVWSGSLSSVVGLQKRGLRGLMEGRKMREQEEVGG